MQQLEIERSASTVPGVVVLALKGPFTLATMFQFQSALRDSTAGGVIVDMSGVSNLDSAGLGVLLGQWSHAQRVEQKFALAAIGPRVLNILRITHTDKVLPVFATVAEAETALL